MTRLIVLLVALAMSGVAIVPAAVQASVVEHRPPEADFSVGEDISAKPKPANPESWQDCTSCHKLDGHNHAGVCVWCHVVEESVAEVGHPVFERISDRTCVGCHRAGTLP